MHCLSKMGIRERGSGKFSGHLLCARPCTKLPSYISEHSPQTSLPLWSCHSRLEAYFPQSQADHCERDHCHFEDPASKMQAQSPVVIVSQPGCGPMPQTSNWQTGMCDCFSDCGVCLCGTFCFMCLACQVAADMNECCLCGTSVAMRTLYRTRYGIPGSICDDYMVTLCCPQCSLCQIKRDINRRRAMRTF